MAQKTSFYHSELVKEGPLEVEMTCDGPIESKFKKDSYYVTFKWGGDPWTYAIENDECGAALTGLKGQTVTITAQGSREDATITVEGAEPQQRRQPAKQPPQRQAAPPARQPAAREPERRLTPEEKAEEEQKAFKRMRATGARAAVMMESSLRFALGIARKLNTDFPEYPFTPEDIEKIAVTHFIETKSYTDVKALPIKFPDAPAAKAPPVRQPAPPPEPEREPEPADDGGVEDDDIPF